MAKGIVVGIDLGTTNSAISVIKQGNRPEIIKVANRVTMPSVVEWHHGEFIVGMEAYNHREQPNVCYSIKSHMQDPNYKFTFVDGNDTLTMTASEISAEILKGLIQKADKMYGNIEEAVITVPARFNILGTKATIEAARLAGIKVLKIICEPTSAALTIDVSKLKSKVTDLLVYDLGGGTFDISAIRITKMNENNSGKNLLFDTIWKDEDRSCDISDNENNGTIITVLNTDGDPHLGGDDLDKEVLAIFLQKVIAKHPNLTKDSFTDEYLEKTLLTLESIKKQVLAERSDSIFNIDINTVLKNKFEFKDTVVLCRADYVKATEVIYNKTKEKLLNVLKETKQFNPQSILFVGGSTKNLILQDFLRRDFPKLALDSSLNPDESVALGAGIQSKLCKYGDVNFRVFDILSQGIGIQDDDFVNVVIEKATTLPAVKRLVFTTMKDYQEEVRVAIYQGDSKYINENVYLGDIIIDDIKPALKGEPVLAITLTVDVNSVLTITAEIDGVKKELVLELTGIQQKPAKKESAHSKVMQRWKHALSGMSGTAYAEQLKPLIEQAESELTSDLRVSISNIIEQHADAIDFINQVEAEFGIYESASVPVLKEYLESAKYYLTPELKNNIEKVCTKIANENSK